MKMSLEENIVFAEGVLTPVMSIIDMACSTFDHEKLRGTLEAMRKQTSYMAAWPFPETMEQAETDKHKVFILEKIIELIELRHELRAHLLKDKTSSGNKILSLLDR